MRMHEYSRVSSASRSHEAVHYIIHINLQLTSLYTAADMGVCCYTGTNKVTPSSELQEIDSNIPIAEPEIDPKVCESVIEEAKILDMAKTSNIVTPVAEQEIDPQVWGSVIEEAKILNMAKAAVESFTHTNPDTGHDPAGKDEDDISHYPAPRQHGADIAEESKSKRRSKRYSYNAAITYGTADMMCGRIMMIGEEETGRSTLLKEILSSDSVKAKGHYPLCEHEDGSFTIMTKDQEIQTLALMTLRVTINSESHGGSSVLKDLSSKVKLVLSTSGRTGCKIKKTLGCLEEIVKTVHSEVYKKTRKIPFQPHKHYECSGSCVRRFVARLRSTVKKKGPRGVTAQECYSPGGVLVTHKGVLLTSMSVGKVW